jgi:collagenase-like PrtC family protease
MTALVLGPVFFNWDPATWRDFYLRIADEAPVDGVCVGEVVCVKRQPFFAEHLPEVIERLTASGKEVVLSTLGLVGTSREMAAVEAVAAAENLLVEANDAAALGLLAGRPHAIGPLVNVYNEGALDVLAARGAVRVCLPPELPVSSAIAIARAGAALVEVVVFGRLPLAMSARCFHARAHGLAKDGCQFVCGRDPDGLAVSTLDGEPFLAINGTQTLSRSCCNLAGEIAGLRAGGIARFRLSPQSCDMVAVARVFRDVLDGRSDGDAATARLAALVGPDMPFANGFARAREGRALVRGE